MATLGSPILALAPGWTGVAYGPGIPAVSGQNTINQGGNQNTTANTPSTLKTITDPLTGLTFQTEQADTPTDTFINGGYATGNSIFTTNQRVGTSYAFGVSPAHANFGQDPAANAALATDSDPVSDATGGFMDTNTLLFVAALVGIYFIFIK